MKDYSKELIEWAEASAKASVPGIKDSQMFVALTTEHYMKDPLCALQIGFALLMDKPIMVIAPRDQKVSSRLLRVADHIEKADFDSKEDVERATKAIMDFAEANLK